MQGFVYGCGAVTLIVTALLGGDRFAPPLNSNMLRFSLWEKLARRRRD